MAVTCIRTIYTRAQDSLCVTYKKERKGFYFTHNEFDEYKTPKKYMTAFIMCILSPCLLFPANKHHPFSMSNQPKLIIFLFINKPQYITSITLKTFLPHFSLRKSLE